MEYDFDKTVDRRGTGSLKWDVAEGELPMWVADMDFQTAPAIRQAIERRVAHGVFGYSILPDAWQQAYIHWWEERHHFSIRPDWLIFATGVVPAISSAVRKLTTVGENVLVQSPCYNIFFNSIYNNGRNIIENRLRYEDGRYSVDWEQLKEQLADPQTSLMILCNPHNPVGKIWERETLAKIGELCSEYGVTVISDEIHCDLTDPGTEYIPFAAVSDICRDISVTCIAPTKAFNIAGLQTAAVFAVDDRLRHKMWRGLNTDEVAEPNAFAVDAAVAAFEESGDWLDALREYIYQNKRYVTDFIGQKLPQVRVVSGQATYLMWLDVGGLGGDTSRIAHFIRSHSGLFMSAGKEYRGNGGHFLRLNVACPRATLEDGMDRLKKSVDEWLIKNR